MRAFAHALQLDESYFDQHGDASSPQIPGTPVQGHTNHTRIRKISALSDFAPINLKIKRFVNTQASGLFSALTHDTSRGRKKKHQDRRSDYLFLLLRWPLLVRAFE